MDSPQSFNSRAPCGARLSWSNMDYDFFMVSIHAPRVGRDLRRPPLIPLLAFQFTRPVWGATSARGRAGGAASFNSRAPCGARLGVKKKNASSKVSIHAPRVGRDGARALWQGRTQRFNSRAPCGARLSRIKSATDAAMFQFTRPVWGATCRPPAHNARSPVSIHAPRVGRDVPDLPSAATGAFQFTRPVWGATPGVHEGTQARRVSIHAPRVGRDRASVAACRGCRGFNSRAPCGARLVAVSCRQL